MAGLRNAINTIALGYVWRLPPPTPPQPPNPVQVGGICRRVGALSLQAVVPIAVETLLAVAAASDVSISVWLLHALLCAANAAGPAFAPHVDASLALAQGMLLGQDVYAVAALLPCVGRLANALVAVMGPDYTFGSRAYLACKSIINDMGALQAGAAGPVAEEDALAGELERVLYTQMLVLFAPQAATIKSSVEVRGKGGGIEAWGGRKGCVAGGQPSSLSAHNGRNFSSPPPPPQPRILFIHPSYMHSGS